MPDIAEGDARLLSASLTAGPAPAYAGSARPALPAWTPSLRQRTRFPLGAAPLLLPAPPSSALGEPDARSRARLRA
eukprot:2148387-Alexandrium_andersonii.AAC.1